MSDSNFKTLRKQLRNVVQEQLGATLTAELASEVEKRVVAHIDQRLDSISKHIEDTLTKVDQRSQDIQGFLIRQASAGITPPVPAETEAPSPAQS